MSKVSINESTLTAIGAAIREKTGKSDLIAPGDMPNEIKNIQSGGGEVEPIVLTGSQQYSCAGGVSSQYIKSYGNTITTKDITDASFMFYKSTLAKVPFSINFKQSGVTYHAITSMFSTSALETLPSMTNLKPGGLQNLFENCSYLREMPDNYFDNWDWSYLTGLTNSTYSGGMPSMFSGCSSLRKLPNLKALKGNSNITTTQSMYYNLFPRCYVLDEVVDLPLPHYASTWTGNAFYNTFHNCQRLKKLTFALQEDGSPYVMKWKSQTIDLSSPNNLYPVGYGLTASDILNYNSGITADKEVKDDATYQALKNDPDWFTCTVNYSRYNHDSAVETINSLPDTSAYLASAGGTNTIKFKGIAGTLTDGGAINTLTEEEIAVAAAKGWTVTLV